MIHVQAKTANVVLDIGSYHTYAGLAGLENPRFASHSYVVQNTSLKKGEYQAGKQALNSENVQKQIHSVFQSIDPYGKVNKFHFDIDKFDKFIETILMDNLELDNYSISLLIAEDMSVELEQNQILKQRQKILDYLLEGMELSNIAFVKKPILSTFGVGRTSSTVLDSGHSFSHCTIVEDGYCVYNKTVRFGGSTLHRMVKQDIEKKSGKEFKTTIENLPEPFKESVVRFHRSLELENIINKFGYFMVKTSMPAEDNQISYTLPDGQNIKIKRSEIIDPFVNYPSFWKLYLRQIKQSLPHCIDSHFLKTADCYRGLEQMVYDTIDEYFVNLDHKNHTVTSSSNHGQNSDANRQKNQLSHEELLSNVILTGGNLYFNDLSWKISQGIRNRGGQTIEPSLEFNKDKTTGNQISNNNSLSWIGGSIVCGLDVFNHFWIRQSEWKQFGTNLLTSKSLAVDVLKNIEIASIEEMVKKGKKLELISKKCA